MVEVVVVVLAVEPETQKIACFFGCRAAAAADLRRRQRICGGGRVTAAVAGFRRRQVFCGGGGVLGDGGMYSAVAAGF
jgi:hypothetical protein